MNLYSFAALWLRTIAINAPLSSRVSSKRYEVNAVSSQNLSKRDLIPDPLAEINLQTKGSCLLKIWSHKPTTRTAGC